MKATLILENGAVFVGESIGSTEDVVCELVFNTSMVGYQEILTDPSYAGQGLVMTYPLIGNYGTNDEDDESEHPWAEALVIRHLAPRGSNFRCTSTLNDYLIRHGITGIQDIDTRALTRLLRKQGVMNAVITCREDYDLQSLMDQMRAYRVRGAVEKVTPREVTHLAGQGRKLALVDFGEKRSMIRRFAEHGCDVTVYPASVSAEELLAGGYEGLVLSDGPGDPAESDTIIAEVKKLYASGIPMFGMGLGHQLIALAAGFNTRKMLFGHRGANHAVKDLEQGRCFITSQNHGYEVVRESVEESVAAISFVNVNDGSVEGLTWLAKPILTVQFQPETAPASLAADHQICRFLELAEENGKGGNCNA